MATVFIPTQLRDATESQAQVEVDGARVRDVIDALEQRFPGVRARLCDGEQLSPSLQVSIDGVISTRGLAAKVPPGGEVHFLPAIGGG
ncbi:MAG: MoaD/ThiS family protein [Pirellulaceae bacterium]